MVISPCPVPLLSVCSQSVYTIDSTYSKNTVVLLNFWPMPATTVNTLPLFCLTSPWCHLSIFTSACLVFSFHRVFLPVFRCTGFWLWSHSRGILEHRCKLSAGVPVVVLLAARMHWSDVPSSLPSAIVDMLSSQNLVFVFCPQPSVSTFHTHIVPR